jgi:hypothetical protein
VGKLHPFVTSALSQIIYKFVYWHITIFGVFFMFILGKDIFKVGYACGCLLISFLVLPISLVMWITMGNDVVMIWMNGQKHSSNIILDFVDRGVTSDNWIWGFLVWIISKFIFHYLTKIIIMYILVLGK